MIEKKVCWVGSSLQELKAVSKQVKKAIGFELNLLQHGEESRDFKPMVSVGKGVFEIRVRDEHNKNVGRCFYVAKFEDSIFVLHVFIKKSQKTPLLNLAVGKKRYQELLRFLGNKNGRKI